MKMPVKHFVNRFVQTFLVLLAALVWTVGCAGLVRHPDPLVGWQFAFNQEPNQTIVKDYQDYIKSLPAKQRNDVHVKDFYKDGFGQHAVQIEVGVNGIFYGTLWEHVLIYDKDNKRIKVIKYGGGKYGQW